MNAHEPGPATGDPAGLFSSYLDFYRDRAIEKVTGLSAEEQRSARLPSGWTPLELLFHLACMERRWFVWGFLGEPVRASVGGLRGQPGRPLVGAVRDGSRRRGGAAAVGG